MPAKNPRLTITLQPSLAAQLRKLSELTGNSQSALIGDLLEGTGPVFDRMIQVLEAAKSAKESIRGKLADDMEHAQAKMEGALGHLFFQKCARTEVIHAQHGGKNGRSAEAHRQDEAGREATWEAHGEVSRSGRNRASGG